MQCKRCGYHKKGKTCDICLMKTKEDSIPKLVKELDRVFSIFIRRREADELGRAKCFTCGKFAYYMYMDCGHYVSRANKTLRWNEDNCHVQCKHCNITLKGNYPAYAIALQRKLGVGILEKLDWMKSFPYKHDRGKLKLLIDHYSKLIK